MTYNVFGGTLNLAQFKCDHKTFRPEYGILLGTDIDSVPYT